MEMKNYIIIIIIIIFLMGGYFVYQNLTTTPTVTNIQTEQPENDKTYSVQELINSGLPEGQRVKVRGIMGPYIQLKVSEDYEGPGSGCILTSSDYNEKNKGYSIHIGKEFPEYNGKEIIVSGLVRYCGGNKIPRYICGLTNVEFIDSIQ
jgi:hypothetical protein